LLKSSDIDLTSSSCLVQILLLRHLTHLIHPSHSHLTLSGEQSLYLIDSLRGSTSSRSELGLLKSCEIERLRRLLTWLLLNLTLLLLLSYLRVSLSHLRLVRLTRHIELVLIRHFRFLHRKAKGKGRLMGVVWGYRKLVGESCDEDLRTL